MNRFETLFFSIATPPTVNTDDDSCASMQYDTADINVHVAEVFPVPFASTSDSQRSNDFIPIWHINVIVVTKKSKYTTMVFN
jgi:hypothetical protein